MRRTASPWSWRSHLAHLATVVEGLTLEAAFRLAVELNAAGDGFRYGFHTMPLGRQVELLTAGETAALSRAA